MLEKQVLKDQTGNPMGIFIPMQTWESIIIHYPDIEMLENDIPQWEKDFVNKRLELSQHHPERLIPFSNLMKFL